MPMSLARTILLVILKPADSTVFRAYSKGQPSTVTIFFAALVFPRTGGIPRGTEGKQPIATFLSQAL